MDDSIITTQAPNSALPSESVVITERPGDRNGTEIQLTAPLRSAEAFETYCHHVQARLAEHALRRRSFLQNAYDRLTQLLHAARAVEDNALYNELWQVRLATRELLEALKHLSPAENSGWQSVSPPSKPMPLPASNGYRSTSNERIETAEHSVTGRRDTLPPLYTSSSPVGHAVVAAPRLPRRPARPLEDIESDAKRLRDQISEWKEKYPLKGTDDCLIAPNCLRLRGWICRLRRLEEEAGDTEIVEVTEIIDDLVAMLDAVGDEEYTVALDDELNPPPTAFQWGELGERYEETALAQEAFDWWYANHNTLTTQTVQPVAEAVAAVQQRFNRLLFRIGARDPFQQRLFDSLRAWARESQCYLHSLRPKVPIAELIERASTLEDSWQKARDALNSEGNC